jgi:hypothetical protein
MCEVPSLIWMIDARPHAHNPAIHSPAVGVKAETRGAIDYSRPPGFRYRFESPSLVWMIGTHPHAHNRAVHCAAVGVKAVVRRAIFYSPVTSPKIFKGPLLICMIGTRPHAHNPAARCAAVGVKAEAARMVKNFICFCGGSYGYRGKKKYNKKSAHLFDSFQKRL